MASPRGRLVGLQQEIDPATGLDEGMGGVDDAFVVGLDQPAGGLERIGSHVGEAVEALSFELTSQRRHLEGEHRRVDHLGRRRRRRRRR